MDTLCIPMKVDVFLMNNTEVANLAPIVQPEYAYLRAHKNLLRHDILKHINPLSSYSGDSDSLYNYCDRLHDITRSGGDNQGTVMAENSRWNRWGTYVSWTLPSFYRTGLSSTSSNKDGPTLRSVGGYPLANKGDPQFPIHRPPPNRWIVIRHANSDLLENTETVKVFVIESDRIRKVSDFSPEVDLEVEAAPFIDEAGAKNSSLSSQGQIFVGLKQPLDGWEENPSVPRASLSNANSFNPLFTDYQPHNSNVFSMIDEFLYPIVEPLNQFLRGTVDYYVIGWHSDPKDDPFYSDPKSLSVDCEARLKACSMQLSNTSSQEVATWLQSKLGNTRVIVHGAIYGFKWDPYTMMDSKLPKWPAKDITDHYREFAPVSVGAYPLDALLAATESHSLSLTKSKGKESHLAKDILAMQTLVVEPNEDPDSQLRASDALSVSAFAPSDPGLQWHLSGSSDVTKRPTVPSTAELNHLKEVNEFQLAADLCTREMKWLQWEIWAEWWKWVTFKGDHSDNETTKVKAEVDAMTTRYKLLKESVEAWKAEITTISKLYKWQSVTSPRYYLLKDPTVLLCNMKCGWPADYLDPLKVRLNSQLDSLDTRFETDKNSIKKALPSDLQSTGFSLMSEFFQLLPQSSGAPLEVTVPPLYHDRDQYGQMRDHCIDDTQPWFPLFVEWAIEYAHIDKDSWQLKPQQAFGPPVLQSELKEDTNLNNVPSTQIITGRSLILPQTTTMLRNAVERLLKIKSTKPNNRAEIDDAINKLEYLSFSLTGFRDHLMTRLHGTHLSPTMYSPQSNKYEPTPAAVKLSKGVFSEEAIELMIDTNLTPFGDYADFGAVSSPFRPVVHGQFRFTKLNVIDKFGQIVCVIDPTPGAKPNLQPFVSQYYACSSTDAKTPRGLFGTQTVQIPRSINQASRINAHYVHWDTNGGGMWVPMTEYENPVWGWLVVNYIDSGLQAYSAEGKFYGEIRDGGRTLPFSGDDSILSKELRLLVQKLIQNNDGYFNTFFKVVTRAIDAGATQHAPNSYAGHLSAIIGRPLALVTTGWSLELARPFYTNHSTISTPVHSISDYRFPIKFGDKDRNYDGLLGFFNETSRGEFDLAQFYTYFNSQDDPKSIMPIEPDSHTFAAFYTSPYIKSSNEVRDAKVIAQEYSKQLQVVAMLVDPFTPVHAYSGFHPPMKLEIPHWVVEKTMKDITAFFHLGPLVIPQDIPAYDPNRKLTTNASLDNIPDAPKDVPGLPAPTVTVADWAWLQPYISATGNSFAFNPLPVTAVPKEPGLEAPPYTAVDGYLYQKRPIATGDGNTF